MANEVDKQKLQEDIDLKKKELDELKTKTLSDIDKKNQEDKINEEIKVLQKKLDDLKALESQNAVNTAQQSADQLKQQVDTEPSKPDWTYELIQGSEMEKKLKALGKSDVEVKEFSNKIDAVVRKFLDKELDGFSNKVKNSACVGIQFAMMETLTADGANGASFFEAFGKTDVSSGVSSLEGFFKAFSGGIGGMFGNLTKGTKFFDLANRVQNLTYYLKLNKNIIATSQNIPELMNPARFKTLLNNPLWDVTDNVYKTPISSVMKINSTDGVTMTDAEKKSLQDIANNPNMPINEKTIDAITKSLGTADKFLDTRDKYQDSATSLMSKVGGLLDINIPLVGKLGSLFGMDWPIDAIGGRKKKPSKVLDLVLRFLGFPGGMKGLHDKYIRENVDTYMVDDVFVKNSYRYFESKLSSDTVKTNDDAGSTWKKFESTFKGLKEDEKTFLKNKFPPNYDLIKTSLVESLKNDTKLNAPAVAQFAPELITTSGTENIVDLTKITDKAAFAERYLQFIIPKLAGSADKFISSENVNQKTFALAIFGNLVADKFFIEGVNIGVVNLQDYADPALQVAPQTPGTSQNTPSFMEINESDPELVRLATGPNEDYSKNSKFVQYLSTLEKKNGLASSLMLNLMLAESAGHLYDKGHIIGSTAGARGLFQFMPDTAKGYIKKLGLPESDYEKIFTNPIIGAQACAAFLKERKDKGATSTEICSDYNAGPGKRAGRAMSPQVFRSLPKETQGYIVTIGSGMLASNGKPELIAKEYRKNTDQISDATLTSFFAAVDAIASPSVSSSPEVLADKEQFWKKTVFMGDSITVGYAQYQKYNNQPYKVDDRIDSRTNAPIMGGKQTSWMLENVDALIDRYPESETFVLLGGANDLYCPIGYDKEKGAQRIYDNLVKIIDKVKAKKPNMKIIIGTLTPTKGGMDNVASWTEEQKKTALDNLLKLNEMIKTGFPNNYVDFYKLLEDPNKPGYLVSQGSNGDGLHPYKDYPRMNDLVFEKWKTQQQMVA